MGIIITFVFAAYVVVSVIICVIVGAVSKSNKAVAISVALCVLVPFYDVVPTRIIANKYCQIEPKSKIDKIVEYPKSVYVKINSSDKDEILYNGQLCGEFDEAMLDGIHVEKMAVNCYGEIIQKEFDTNSSDYKQYINLISQYQNLHADKSAQFDFYRKNKKAIEEAKFKITKRNEVEKDRDIIKNYNYSIIINKSEKISDSLFENAFYHIVNVSIVENKTEKEIAFWKMYIRNNEATFIFPEILMPHFADDYQFTNKVCGKIQEIEKVFDMKKWSFDFSNLFDYRIYLR
ncbi:hypothetical protein OFO10_06215 [Campylobacter sp. VBCF_06 NA8]|uniref:hypothetical protein n=1 Tax=Campylobacter sp. VBCF_06 NA8 TaxID=2983822 RepID=UPI0022E9DAA2|nr:hypothetical protein [Campylobacter sp. VBCF_06 NA8]MDA3046747.1 hypothetical protein [Campylobacter sp. VBCF_06 NA8]